MKKNKIFTVLILFLAVLLLSYIYFYYYEKKGSEKGGIIDDGATAMDNHKTTSTDDLPETVEEEPYVFTRDNVLTEDNADELIIPKDSNNDGISDKKSQELGLNPDLLDTDGDGIFDIDEIEITNTDPKNPDSDGDGYGDLEELRGGYNPNGPGKL